MSPGSGEGAGHAAAAPLGACSRGQRGPEAGLAAVDVRVAPDPHPPFRFAAAVTLGLRGADSACPEAAAGGARGSR